MLEPHFESHDGRIDGDKDVPRLGRYIDFGGFWSDEYCLTIDHHIMSLRDGSIDVNPKINGKQIKTFTFMVKVGSENERPTAINPTNEVHKEDDPLTETQS